MAELLLSPKYKDFLRHKAPVEFLEGTTLAGKTTVGVFKFMLEVRRSSKKLHILAGLDLGTIEKNIINKDLGITDIFGSLVRHNASGRGVHSLPHIEFDDKVIYVLGYDNKSRWQKALGGQYGCLFIDEINIADMEFVREASMRCDYLIGTLNPDNPGLPVYEEYINHSRPLEKYKNDAPRELNEMLKEEPKENWTHWFFSFDHNLGLSEEKKQQAISMVAPGTKLYQNKILGIRSKATGLIYSNYETRGFDVFSSEFQREHKTTPKSGFYFGLDFGYTNNPSGLFCGFVDERNMEIYVFDEMYERALTNARIAEEITLKGYRKERIIADSAEPKSIDELYDLGLKGIEAARKGKDSVNHGIQFIQRFKIIIHPKCINFKTEIENYSWQEDRQGVRLNAPLQAFDHLMDAMRYALERLIKGETFSFE